MELRPGERMEHLLLERELGRGAFGRVWLARDTLLRRPVALKVLSPSVYATPEDRERMLAEARLISRLHDPHVVTLYRVHSLPDGGWAFELEYVEGGSLADRLADESPLPTGSALPIARAMARALAVAHAAGITHGDVKPANVLVHRDGTAKLADFGLAAAAVEDASSRGELVGTPRYLAPEVIMGRRPTPASDVWGLGLILYQLFVGAHPFPSTSLAQVFHAVQNDPLPPLPPHVPGSLASILQSCLEKDPARRPSSARVVAMLGETDLAARPLPRPPAARHLESYFGRERERAIALALLDRVARGEAAALLVAGEAGIGKTAFLGNLAAEAEHRGFDWIVVPVTPIEGLVRPLLHALRQHAGATADGDGPTPSAESLDELIAHQEQLSSRRQLLWILHRLLEPRRSRRPLGVVIENAHQCGAEDARLIFELARRREAGRTLLVATYRLHDESDTARSDDAASVREWYACTEFTRIELGPLPPNDLLGMLEHESGLHLSPDVVRRIARLSEGNPLFARELLRHLRERGGIVPANGTLVPGPGWEDRGLPRRIRDLVLRRLQGLSEEERELLDVAAVDGLAFDGEALAAVLERPLLGVLRALQNLYREKGLVTPEEGGFRFSHATIHEVILDQTARALRLEVHRRLAEHLEQRPGSKPERVGHHWREAGEAARARPHLLAAARDAAWRQEIARTIRLCELAGLSPERIDPATARADESSLFVLASCLDDNGRYVEAQKIYDALLAAAEESGDELARLRLVVRRSRTSLFVSGVRSVDEEGLRRAVETLPAGADAARARYVLGLLAKFRGDVGEARGWFEDAGGIYRDMNEAAGVSDVLDQLGTLARLEGRLEEAAQAHAEAARLSASVGRRTNAAISEVNRILAQFDRGALEGLAPDLEQAIRTLQIEGATDQAAHASLVLAHVVYASGDAPRALEEARRAVESLQRSGYLPGLTSAHLVAAELELARLDLEAAARSLGDAVRTAETAGKRSSLLHARVLQARLHALLGHVEEARDEARRCLERMKDVSPMDRSEVTMMLGESALYGLPADAVAALGTDGLPPAATAVVRGALAVVDPAADAGVLHECARALVEDPPGERRAALRVLAGWFASAARLREGAPMAAAEDGRRAQDLARRLGHRLLERSLGRFLDSCSAPPA